MNQSQFYLFAKRFKEALVLLDSNGLLVSWNPAAGEFFQLSSAQHNTAHINLTDLVTDEQSKVTRAIELWKGSGEFLPSQFSVKKLDGVIVDCSIEGCLLEPASEGQVAHLLLRCFTKAHTTKQFVALNEKINQLTKEIHERIKIENGLRESEAKVRLLLDSTAEALYGMDANGICMFVNQTFIEMLGFTDESELIGKEIHNLIHHSDAQGNPISREESDIYQSLTHAKEVYCNDTVVWMPNGNSIPVECWAHPIKQGNTTLGAVVTLIDISEKKRINTAMKTLAQTTSSVEGRQFFKVCSASLSEICQSNVVIIGKLDIRQPQLLDTLAIYQNGHHQENKMLDLRHSPCATTITGKLTYIRTGLAEMYPDYPMLQSEQLDSYYGVPLVSSDGHIMGIVAILNTKPITIDERLESILQVFAKRIAMELEQQVTTDALHEYQNHLETLVSQRTSELEQAYKELESYSYSIAHDLRSPLRSIASFSQILKEDLEGKLNHTEADYFERIINASEFMSELINDILQLSRISRADMTTTTIDLSQLVQEIIKEKLNHFPGRQFSIHVQSGIYVNGDESLNYLLLDNLIDNAIKFSEKKSVTYIKFGHYANDAGQVVCYVKDHGAGFDYRYKEKLFNPFQRLHGREEFEGTGIGLATVKRIMERHDGDIWVEAQINQGACFYFTSPYYYLNKPEAKARPTLAI